MLNKLVFFTTGGCVVSHLRYRYVVKRFNLDVPSAITAMDQAFVMAVMESLYQLPRGEAPAPVGNAQYVLYESASGFLDLRVWWQAGTEPEPPYAEQKLVFSGKRHSSVLSAGNSTFTFELLGRTDWFLIITAGDAIAC